MDNPHMVEIIMRERMNRYRAEGLKSQEIARALKQGERHNVALREFFYRLLFFRPRKETNSPVNPCLQTLDNETYHMAP